MKLISGSVLRDSRLVMLSLSCSLAGRGEEESSARLPIVRDHMQEKLLFRFMTKDRKLLRIFGLKSLSFGTFLISCDKALHATDLGENMQFNV